MLLILSSLLTVITIASVVAVVLIYKKNKEFVTQLSDVQYQMMANEATTRDLQDALRQAEEASYSKDAFLAQMSHELRTPMNGVLGMADLLEFSDLDPEQRDLVATIRTSAEALISLVNDILDISKIETGNMTLEYIPFNLHEVLSAPVELLTPQAESKGIKLFVEYENVPQYIWGDPARLRQVLINIVGNAIKFTEQGYVNLSAELTQDNKLNLRINDTGIGIPAEKLNTVFEKFTQGDSSIARRFGGTGLGLTISRQLVNLMDGQIGVESVVGKGSTFWINLPCQPATAEDLQEAAPQTLPQASSTKKIAAADAHLMIVDDHPINRLLAEKLLRRFGFKQITLANNGKEALAAYAQHKPDFILMDCQMPEMDGYDATRTIRELEQKQSLHTPIIAATAYAMLGDREKCLACGMDDYVSKPIRNEQLQAILSVHFNLLEVKNAPKNPPQSNDDPINLEHLQSFTDGNPDEERVLLSIFMEQAHLSLSEAEKNLTEQQPDAWQKTMHRLKGAAGNLGAQQLHKLCKEAEASHQAENSIKQDLLQQIKQAVSEVERFTQQRHPG